MLNLAWWTGSTIANRTTRIPGDLSAECKNPSGTAIQWRIIFPVTLWTIMKVITKNYEKKCQVTNKDMEVVHIVYSVIVITIISGEQKQQRVKDQL
ncbi:hypothetical protein JTB14_012418 [Gonioctena quinquepunctata]|nr:hypothetical protein JTB14_012418 [Gonioctena quinquepunctata]